MEERVGVVFQRVLAFYGDEFEEEKYGVDLTCQDIFYKKLQEGEQSKQN